MGSSDSQKNYELMSEHAKPSEKVIILDPQCSLTKSGVPRHIRGKVLRLGQERHCRARISNGHFRRRHWRRRNTQSITAERTRGAKT